MQDGRQLSQAGLTFNEMIDFTRAYFTKDIVTLYNLDGGGSSSFVYGGKKLNGDEINKSTGKRTERTVTGIFYW